MKLPRDNISPRNVVNRFTSSARGMEQSVFHLDKASLAKQLDKIEHHWASISPTLKAIEQRGVGQANDLSTDVQKHLSYLIHSVEKSHRFILYLLMSLGILILISASVFLSKNWLSPFSKEVKKGKSIIERSLAEAVPATLSRSPGSLKNYPVRGIDISHWDGAIDWHTLQKQNLTFVFIKASQGGNVVDPSFKEHWESAKSYKIPRGAYHYYDPAVKPALQAEHFLKTVNYEKGDFVPILDIEVAGSLSKSELSRGIEIWLDTVGRRVGHKPIIYTYKNFWESHVEADKFSHYPLWVAEYDGGSHGPMIPLGWKRWDFWQYSAKGVLKGVGSPAVDFNCFNGKAEGLKHYQIK